jgi:hypothetical protein
MIRDGTIRIAPLNPRVGPGIRTGHEATHFIEDDFRDWAYRDRTGSATREEVHRSSCPICLSNPDSYAYLALQMARGINRVLKKKG